MTLFDRPIGPEAYAAIRFGQGYPARGAPVTAGDMLARLAGPDEIAAALPRVGFGAALDLFRAYQMAKRANKRQMADNDAELTAARKAIAGAFEQAFLLDVARSVETADPFRERLARFWENHFAAAARTRVMRAAGAGYADEAIRPHVAGPFGALLKAAATHPYMLAYLDQNVSVGPNSPVGRKRGRGLNENLAREILELHTVGVGGPYGQTDVTEFAELLTGLSFSPKRGAVFRPNWAEPGAETVLGAEYGGGKARLADIHAALDDLAVHPATAAHLSGKIAAHFVADAPDPDLVAHMTAAWRASDGHLMRVYAAMLEHPAAWRGFGAKVKPPFDYIASALRALGLRGDDLRSMGRNQAVRRLLRPMRFMGQPYQQPPGPDGFPDAAGAWAQPHGLASRIAWALAAAKDLGASAGEPRAFAEAALGDAASGRLLWAAEAAETRAEGVGVVLASAEFNRR